MSLSHRCGWIGITLAFPLICLCACDSKGQGSAASGSLDAAIKARTDLSTLKDQAARTVDSEVREVMRKVITKAEEQELRGNILLNKDQYTQAVEAFRESARLYQQVVDGKEVVKRIAKARESVGRAKALVDSSTPSDRVETARRLELDADGYLEAGDADQCLAKLEAARKAYEALAPAGGASASLEEAVAARTAMLSVRKQIKDTPTRSGGFSRSNRSDKPKPGSLTDVLRQAHEADTAAGAALESKDYGPARALFAKAETQYRQALTLQAERDKVLAARQAAEDSQKLADKAFTSEARPASFEKGKQALADADTALAEDDLEKARPLLAQAAEHFAQAHGEAESANALGKAQEAWAAGLAAVEENEVKRFAAGQFDAAKAKAAEAERKAAAGQNESATALFKEAAATLRKAADTATTAKNLANATPIVTKLERALADKAKFDAESRLARLRELIPGDARIAGWRSQADALPWPKSVGVDLGGGVMMELLMIPTGSFTMGSSDGPDDEKPARRVSISKPFYLGKYEVTQEQWQAVMGGNPSNFKGAKRPVEHVSWDDCQEFLKKLAAKSPGLKFSLPTEAQWEYACRAGSKAKYSFGDDEARLGDYAWYTDNSGNTTHDVGEKQPNKWGLHDMHGNVWEWCAGLYGEYPKGAQKDPTGPASGQARVLRGGGWADNPRYCRSASRSGPAPAYRNHFIGLRVVVLSSGTP